MYKHLTRGWMKHLDFILMDIILMLAAFVISYAARQGNIWFYRLPMYRSMIWTLILVELLVALFFGTYSGILRRGVFQEFKAVLKHLSLSMGIFIVLVYAARVAEGYSCTILFGTWALSVFFILIGHLLLKRRIRRQTKHKENVSSLLVVTDYAHARDVLRILEENQNGSYRIDSVAILDRNMRGKQIGNFTVSANEEGIVNYIRSTCIEEVFLYLPEDRKESSFWMNYFQDMGIVVHMGLFYLEPDEKKFRCIERFGGYTVLSSSMRLASPRDLFLKRAMDICGGLVGLLITGIAFIFVAPIIYIQSPGPIFFSQERIGKNGKRFRIYKFRSMYPDAEERKKELMSQNEVSDGMMFKIKNDPRIFPFGHFIRKTSIDELPQFWNVLKGDMSLVGTRPPTVDEWEKYDYRHMKRLAIKPGLTGLWQVSGRSDIQDFEEVVALDAKYISEWRLVSDVKILFKTVWVVARGKGSA